jgi:hypothetical protein
MIPKALTGSTIRATLEIRAHARKDKIKIRTMIIAKTVLRYIFSTLILGRNRIYSSQKKILVKKCKKSQIVKLRAQPEWYRCLGSLEED